MQPGTCISQGCSDAGACTMHDLKISNEADTSMVKMNLFSTGIVFGESQYAVLVFTPFMEYTRYFGKAVSVTARFIAGIRSGELGTTAGPSDLMVSTSYAPITPLKIMAGIKVPLNDANLSQGGKSLPMNYQVSLGSWDLILGLSYSLKRFAFSAGYQQPLSGNNNQFLAESYPANSPESKYYSTNQYLRSADLLVRAAYTPVMRKKVSLVTSLLPIYHLRDDRYSDSTGYSVKIAGSQGLTLNISVILQYRFGKNQWLEFMAKARLCTKFRATRLLPVVGPL